MNAREMPQTVTGLIEAAAVTAPDGVAVHYNTATLTYSGLAGQARRVAGGLAALGVRPGDRVAFWLPNIPAYLTLYFACARLGAVAVAVNTRYRAAEIGDIVGRSGAKVLVLWPDFRGIDFPAILDDVDPAALDRLETVIVYGESADPPSFTLGRARTVSYERIARHARYDRDHGARLAGCNIFTTSGTTQAAKFVLHGHGGITDHALQVAAAFGLGETGTVGYLGLPLCGVFGFTQAMALVAAHKPIVLVSAFDAPEALDLMTRHRVTYFNASDDMVDALLGAAPSSGPFAHIRSVGYATFNASLDDIVTRADARGLTLTALWGMSELQAMVARRAPEDSAERRAIPGGKLISPAAQIRVRDPDSGALLSIGKTGALEISAPSQMLGYYRDPAATQAALCDDGFLRTSDLGHLDPDGGFTFVSRMGDALRLGGFLVGPAEIEAQIQSHSSVDNVQVVAAGNRAVAFVTLAAGSALNETAIQAHCARQLAKYKVPVRIIALDAFPITDSANGEKIQRARLRKMAEALFK
jgi:fatty-acyl-CoA synthase